VAGSLRKFAPPDRDAIVELSRRATGRPELQVGNPVWVSREELESETADWDPPPEETLLVAEQEDGGVVGFGGVELPRGFDHAELFGPLVASDASGQKLGSRLLDASVEEARGRGARTIVGAVGTRNTAARILLERAGFRPRGRPQATYRLNAADHRPVGEPPDGVAIRLATDDDVPPALDVYHECFPEGRFPEAVWRENVAAGTVYVAEREGRVVGVLNIDPSDRWIYHLGVSEEERKHGVGGFLLSRALDDYWARHPGQTLGLDVAADNVPAIRLYRRQGFAPWLVLQTYELPLYRPVQ
jgi:ribosomal protein S18 acetylase RimI-like enzyme